MKHLFQLICIFTVAINTGCVFTKSSMGDIQHDLEYNYSYKASEIVFFNYSYPHITRPDFYRNVNVLQIKPLLDSGYVSLTRNEIKFSDSRGYPVNSIYKVNDFSLTSLLVNDESIILSSNYNIKKLTLDGEILWHHEFWKEYYRDSKGINVRLDKGFNFQSLNYHFFGFQDKVVLPNGEIIGSSNGGHLIAKFDVNGKLKWIVSPFVDDLDKPIFTKHKSCRYFFREVYPELSDTLRPVLPLLISYNTDKIKIINDTLVAVMATNQLGRNSLIKPETHNNDSVYIYYPDSCHNQLKLHYFLVIINTDGEIINKFDIPEDVAYLNFDFVPLNDSTIILSTNKRLKPAYTSYPYIVKLNLKGETIWEANNLVDLIYFPFSTSRSLHLVKSHDSAFIAAGTISLTTIGDHDYYWVTKFTQQGEVVWFKTLNITCKNISSSLAPTPDGGGIITTCMGVLKFAPNGELPTADYELHVYQDTTSLDATRLIVEKFSNYQRPLAFIFSKNSTADLEHKITVLPSRENELDNNLPIVNVPARNFSTWSSRHKDIVEYPETFTVRTWMKPRMVIESLEPGEYYLFFPEQFRYSLELHPYGLKWDRNKDFIPYQRIKVTIRDLSN